MNEDKTAPELKIIGNVMPSGHNVGNIYDPDGISPTLTTPTGGNSMPLILAMEQIPFNTADEGLAYTITTRYGAMCASNLIDGNFSMTGILYNRKPNRRNETPDRRRKS